MPGELDKCVRDMPTVVLDILTNDRWNDVTKIEQAIDQLEKLHNDSYEGANMELIIREIEANIMKLALHKDTAILELISQLKVDEASDELYALTAICDLKCMTDFKKKGMNSLPHPFFCLLPVSPS